MDFPPRIKAIDVFEGFILVVTFQNGIKKVLDFKDKLEEKRFEELRAETKFRTVRIEVGGVALYWDDTMDISENELWEDGIEI